MKSRIAIISSLILLVLTSCQPDTVCRQDSDILCYLHCQDTLAQTIKDTAFVLRSDVDLTPVTIPYQGMTDTLFIHYINDFRYISMACGNFVYHELDSVWTSGPHNVMVWIDEKRVENYPKTHIVMTYIDVK